MESRDFVSIFASLGLEGFRSRLGLEGSKSRSLAYCRYAAIKTCFYIDTSDSLLRLTFTRTQTIPDASEKDETSRNQTHAPKKRIGRMPCASSFRALMYAGFAEKM